MLNEVNPQNETGGEGKIENESERELERERDR